ncbi:MAG: DMT family transporter [Burkholderiales bacterium]|nr:DMT family transporter [Burkholderiales bacterium]
MRRSDLARLCALAMIWSLSFVFMRVVSAPLTPVWTAALRIGIAGTALALWLAATGVDVDLRGRWRAYLWVGLVNSAAPFLLYAWAALTLPASYLVVLNAAAPMFTAVGAAIFFGERLTLPKIAGLAAGAIGVALVSRAGPIEPTPEVIAAVVACLGAAACYAASGLWLKRHGAPLKPVAIAAWSQVLAACALSPIAIATPMPGPVTPVVIANLLGLALLCSGVAYLLYYRLIRDAGPTRAMTVAYLMPPFGMVWGVILLGETITAPMAAGTALVVAGTAAILRPARAA